MVVCWLATHKSAICPDNKGLLQTPSPSPPAHQMQTNRKYSSHPSTELLFYGCDTIRTSDARVYYEDVTKARLACWVSFILYYSDCKMFLISRKLITDAYLVKLFKICPR